MGGVVVDTNVALVANDATSAAPEWDAECILACLAAVEEVRAKRRIILDDQDLIVSEYFNRLDRSGMPGVGDAFAKWAWDHRFVEARCARVALTPQGDSFAEFPPSSDLATFDPSDRKFVAAACSFEGEHEILQAVDSKWWGLRDALAAAGVTVRFVWPDGIEALHERKRKRR
jgi:hypothetical protein